MNRRKTLPGQIRQLCDSTLALMSVVGAYVITSGARFRLGALKLQAAPALSDVAAVSLLALVPSAIALGCLALYGRRGLGVLFREVGFALVTSGTYVTVLLIVSAVMYPDLLTPTPLAWFVSVSALGTVCARLAVCGVQALLGRMGRHAKAVAIIGSGPLAERAARLLENDTRLTLLGHIDSPGALPSSGGGRKELVCTLDALESYLMQTAVDIVVIALPVRSCYEQIQTAIDSCAHVGVEAQYSPALFHCPRGRPQVMDSPTGPVVAIRTNVNHGAILLKRSIDIVGALIAGTVLSPLLLTVAILIKTTSPGPVLYRQQRYGLNRRRLTMLKFRSMVVNADELLAGLELQNEAAGPLFKLRNDPRVTPLGRVLRATSIDELPQLFNVLQGGMSLVGPRPMSLRDVAKVQDPRLMRRFSVKPGMTGLWQISGRSNTGFAEWARFDLDYVDTWSVTLDLRILLQTLPAVLRGDGAV
jgi:exopolysaccharide biosynthesis polyprenyl glycosylphosphotransferase